MLTRLAAPVVSLGWAAVALAATRTSPGGLVLAVVLSYAMIGAGIPTAVALDHWVRAQETAAPRVIVFMLVSMAAAFSASALGGQPLIWTAQWTATRQVLATLVVSLLLALIAFLSGSDDPDPGDVAAP